LGGEYIDHTFFFLTLVSLNSEGVLELGEVINAQRVKSVVGFSKF